MSVVAQALVPAVLAGLPLPRFDDRRPVLAVDASPWFRSDAQQLLTLRNPPRP